MPKETNQRKGTFFKVSSSSCVGWYRSLQMDSGICMPDFIPSSILYTTKMSVETEIPSFDNAYS